MDPLSITSGVLAVAAAGIAVANKLNDLIDGVRDVPNQFASLTSQIRWTATTLELSMEILERHETLFTTKFYDVLKDLAAHFGCIQKLVGKCLKKPKKAGKAGNIWWRLSWLIGSRRLHDLSDRLEALKVSLDLIMTVTNTAIIDSMEKQPMGAEPSLMIIYYREQGIRAVEGIQEAIPALVEFHERVPLGDAPQDDQKLITCTESIRDVATWMAAAMSAPSLPMRALPLGPSAKQVTKCQPDQPVLGPLMRPSPISRSGKNVVFDCQEVKQEVVRNLHIEYLVRREAGGVNITVMNDKPFEKFELDLIACNAAVKNSFRSGNLESTPLMQMRPGDVLDRLLREWTTMGDESIELISRGRSIHHQVSETEDSGENTSESLRPRPHKRVDDDFNPILFNKWAWEFTLKSDRRSSGHHVEAPGVRDRGNFTSDGQGRLIKRFNAPDRLSKGSQPNLSSGYTPHPNSSSHLPSRATWLPGADTQQYFSGPPSGRPAPPQASSIPPSVPYASTTHAQHTKRHANHDSLRLDGFYPNSYNHPQAATASAPKPVSLRHPSHERHRRPSHSTHSDPFPEQPGQKQALFPGPSWHPNTQGDSPQKQGKTVQFKGPNSLLSVAGDPPKRSLEDQIQIEDTTIEILQRRKTAGKLSRRDQEQLDELLAKRRQREAARQAPEVPNDANSKTADDREHSPEILVIRPAHVRKPGKDKFARVEDEDEGEDEAAEIEIKDVPKAPEPPIATLVSEEHEPPLIHSPELDGSGILPSQIHKSPEPPAYPLVDEAKMRHLIEQEVQVDYAQKYAEKEHELEEAKRQAEAKVEVAKAETERLHLEKEELVAEHKAILEAQAEVRMQAIDTTHHRIQEERQDAVEQYKADIQRQEDLKNELRMFVKRREIEAVANYKVEKMRQEAEESVQKLNDEAIRSAFRENLVFQYLVPDQEQHWGQANPDNRLEPPYRGGHLHPPPPRIQIEAPPNPKTEVETASQELEIESYSGDERGSSIAVPPFAPMPPPARKRWPSTPTSQVSHSNTESESDGEEEREEEDGGAQLGPGGCDNLINGKIRDMHEEMELMPHGGDQDWDLECQHSGHEVEQLTAISRPWKGLDHVEFPCLDTIDPLYIRGNDMGQTWYHGSAPFHIVEFHKDYEPEQQNEYLLVSRQWIDPRALDDLGLGYREGPDGLLRLDASLSANYIDQLFRLTYMMRELDLCKNLKTRLQDAEQARIGTPTLLGMSERNTPRIMPSDFVPNTPTSLAPSIGSGTVKLGVMGDKPEGDDEEHGEFDESTSEPGKDESREDIQDREGEGEKARAEVGRLENQFADQDKEPECESRSTKALSELNTVSSPGILSSVMPMLG